MTRTTARPRSDLLARFDGSGVFHRVATIERSADIARLIDDRTVLAVVRIGPDFSRQLAAGQPADIQVIVDGRNSNTAGTAVGYITTIVDGFNADWRAAHGLSGPPVTATCAPGTTAISRPAGT